MKFVRWVIGISIHGDCMGLTFIYHWNQLSFCFSAMDEFGLVLERGRLQWHQSYSRESEEDLGSRCYFVQQVKLNVTIWTKTFSKIDTRCLILWCQHFKLFVSSFFQSRFELRLSQAAATFISCYHELKPAVIVTVTKFTILIGDLRAYLWRKRLTRDFVGFKSQLFTLFGPY